MKYLKKNRGILSEHQIYFQRNNQLPKLKMGQNEINNYYNTCNLYFKYFVMKIKIIFKEHLKCKICDANN